MAQQHHQQYPPPQRTYSPLQRTDSPHHAPSHHGLPGPYAPPLKRQALSPNAQSPYGSPSMQNIQLPNMVYSTPHYGSQSNGHPTYPSPYGPNNHYGSPTGATSNPNRPVTHQGNPAYTQSFPPYSSNNVYGGSHNVNGANNYNTINPPQQQPPPPSQSSPMGGMGPPARPVDKPTDINDLGDVMVGSGIDLREEEAALLGSYSRPGQQRQDIGYGANTLNSHGPSYQYPKTNLYGHNVPGDRDTFYGGGTFNQHPASDKSAEDIAAETRKRALRRTAEIRSYHLNNPFLSGDCVKRRLYKQASGMQVTVPTTGLLTSQPGHAPRQINLQGPDRNEVLKLVQGEDILQLDATLADVLSLISLAAAERMRNLVEDTATLAKGRRLGSHGVVPADLTDLANGNGASEAVSGLPTPGNSAASSKDNLLKRSYSEINQPLAPVSANGRNAASVSLGNPIAEALQTISKAERAQEEERLKKRQRREGNKPGSGTPGTSGVMGEVAPEVEKKAGKAKDKLDASARKALETQQHATTTKTMNMALGISKQKSWMTKGADTGHVNTFLQKPNTTAQTPKAGAPNANGIASTLPKDRIFGEFREDKETGAGIQLRDVVSVLENDGKEKKALQRAYGRLGVLKK